MTTTCKRCGQVLPDNAIHLFRDWPDRARAVSREFPGHPVSVCPTAERFKEAPLP
jgi:hypothetical protein